MVRITTSPEKHNEKPVLFEWKKVNSLSLSTNNETQTTILSETEELSNYQRSICLVSFNCQSV